MLKLLKIGLLISGFFLLGVGLYIGYIFSNLNQEINKDKIDLIVSEIKKVEHQDDRLVRMYAQIYPNALEKSTWNKLWELIWGENNECPCLDISKRYYFYDKKRFSENHYAVSLMLEREVSQSECINFIFDNFDYLFNSKGVKEAAEAYFKKSISELNDRELIGLIIMQKNSSYYNPIKYPEIFEGEIDKVIIEIGK